MLRNVYTHSEFSHAAPLDIQKITPAQWTIEASVNSTGSARGRSRPSSAGILTSPSSIAASRRGWPSRSPRRSVLQSSIIDAENRLHEAIAEKPLVEANHWYHAAATSDGRALRLYVDALDGRGYLLRASTELPGEGSTALGKGDDDAEWSIGRGWQ